MVNQKKKVSKRTRIERVVYIDGIEDIVIYRGLKSSFNFDLEPGWLNALAKFRVRLETDQEFFDRIYDYVRFDPCTISIPVVITDTLVSPEGDTYKLREEKSHVRGDPSPEILAKIIRFVLKCGAYEDKRLDDQEKWFKYNLIDLASKYIDNRRQQE